MNFLRSKLSFILSYSLLSTTALFSDAIYTITNTTELNPSSKKPVRWKDKMHSSYNSFSIGQSLVVINEIVTDPQQDWSSNGFNGVPGNGVVSNVDEYVELYIAKGGLDLSGWTIEVSDGTDFSGDLTSSGAFDVSLYKTATGGSFTNTSVGDYLILANPDGSSAMNNNVKIRLKDSGGHLIDEVKLGGAAGEAPSGNSTNINDEAVLRSPNGYDTDVDQDDFINGKATLGIQNTNPAVSLSASSATIAENGGTSTVTATLSSASSQETTITLGIKAGGSATSGGTDFSLSTTNVVIAVGNTTGTATITGVSDEIVEIDETLTVEITEVTNGVENGTQETGITITDDDQATVTIADVSGNEDDGAITLTVTSDKAVDGGFTVDVNTADGTATIANSDYTAVTSQTLTFAGTAGESETFTVTPTADATPEGSENLTINMDNLQPTTVASGDIDITDGATVTITGDDQNSITINDPTITESEATQTMSFTVSLSSPSVGVTTVDFATSNGTATAGTDYTATSGALTFTNGETSNTIDVTIAGDAMLEANETLTMTISNEAGTAVVITDATGTGTINNNDAAAVTIADVSGAENGGDLTFTATLDNAVQGGFTVDVNTADGTATTADADYTAISSQTLTFTGTAGETQDFTFSPTTDEKVEVNETITISTNNLAATTLAVDISDGATATINNDDQATVTIADVTASEGGGPISLTATLDNPVEGGFTVDVNTADGTATSANDYTALTSETLTFAGTAGETQVFMITPTDDAIGETDESLTVSMNNLVTGLSANITITDNATITIQNDDDNIAPSGYSVAWDDAELNASETTTSFTFAGAEVGASYNYSITSDAGGTAVTGTGTIATATDQIAGIDVSGLNDGTLTLSATLTDPSGNVGTATTANALLDTNAPSISSISVNEGNGAYKAGDIITVAVTFSEVVNVTGLPHILLAVEANGHEAEYNGIGSGTATIQFEYEVEPGHETEDLDYVSASALVLNGGTIRDAVGNDAFVALEDEGDPGSISDSFDVTIDTAEPDIILSTSAGSLVNGVFEVTITFSEEVSGFTLSDVLADNATVDNLTNVTADKEWTVEVTPVSDGTLTVDIPASIATDAAGNDNTVSNTISTTFDGTAPQVISITRLDADQLNNNDADADFSIVFSEDVTGVDVTDFEVVTSATAAGTMNTITVIDAKTYTVNVSGISGQGTLGLNLINDNSIVDAATNALASGSISEVYTINWIPTDIGLSNLEIEENNEVGDVIGLLSSTDQDAGDTHTYSLVSGAGDNDNASFAVVDNALQASESFDFETKENYSIRVRTSDGNGGLFEESFTISIVNILESSIIVSGDGDFGETILGFSVSKDWTITNNGEVPVEVNIAASTNFFSVDPLSVIVPLGETVNVVAVFTPQVAQTYNGALNFSHRDGTESVPVSGVGVIVTDISKPIIADDIRIYPNPVVDKLTIDLSRIQGQEVSLMMLDASGKPVFNQSEIKEKQVEIDVSKFKSGVYLIRIHNETGAVTKKVIIKR